MTPPTFVRPLLPVATEADARATCETIRPYVAEGVDELVFVHVVEKTDDYPDKAPLEARREQAASIFEIVRDAFAADPVPIRTELRYATRVIDEIFATAADVDASTVGFTPRPGNRLTRFLSGDLSRKLLDGHGRPVTVFPPPDRNRLVSADPSVDVGSPSEVLVPYDGSLQSMAAVEYACTTRGDAHVTALHVVKSPETGVYESATGGSSTDYERLGRENRRAVGRLFAAAERTAAERGVDLSTLTLVGNVANTVITYAEQRDVERIVMGRRANPSLADRVFGSTTETVVDGAPVAVTVVE